MVCLARNFKTNAIIAKGRFRLTGRAIECFRGLETTYEPVRIKYTLYWHGSPRARVHGRIVGTGQESAIARIEPRQLKINKSQLLIV